MYLWEICIYIYREREKESGRGRERKSDGEIDRERDSGREKDEERERYKKIREIVGKMKFDITIIDMKLTTIKHLLLPWGHIDRISFILEMRVLGHGGRYGKKWFTLDMVKKRMFLTFEYFISLKHAVGHYDI